MTAMARGTVDGARTFCWHTNKLAAVWHCRFYKLYDSVQLVGGRRQDWVERTVVDLKGGSSRKREVPYVKESQRLVGATRPGF